MTENLNLQGRRIFIKNYENLIYYVKSDNDKYLTLIQMNCDKHTRILNIKLLDNSNSVLLYKHFNETNTNNCKLLKLYKTTYLTRITIINNLCDVSTIRNQINDSIFCDTLHYAYEKSLFHINIKRLVYTIYLKNTIESILSFMNSNDREIISLRNAYHKLHLKNLKDWEIDIMKIEDSETYNKYLILVEKYEKNNQSYRDTLNDECPVCITNKQVHTYYRCEHYICSECFTNWNNIKLTCPLCRGY